jgi:DnaJ-class molecular chaperone
LYSKHARHRIDGWVVPLTIHVSVSWSSPDFTKIIAGGGLPDADGRHGDLIVHFNIQFPTSLRPEQKMLLQVALACPKTLTQEQQAALVSVRNVFHAV